MTIDETKPPVEPQEPIPAPEAAAPTQPESTGAEAPAEPIIAESAVAETPAVAPEVPAATSVSTEEVTASTESAGVTVADDGDLFESYMNAFEEETDRDQGVKRLTKGELIEATVVQVEKDRVFVNIGMKSEGLIPLEHLSVDGLDTAEGNFNVGDKINVVVVKPESGDQNSIVSKKLADFEQVWDRVEDAFKNGTALKAQVIDRVKGGLVVDVGVRGFVPATHVGSGKIRNIDRYVGQELELKVIEIDRERKKVVLSNREAEQKRREEAKSQIFDNIHVGDILDGTVRRLSEYGAFVDLGGVDGLLHISEMSWMRINHPKEMFKEGQKIKVMVLRLEPDKGKISLGHRQVLPDPWKLVKENYASGQKLTVTISRIVQSGAFIKLPEGAEAFMPASEMSSRRIRKPEDVVEEGQELEAHIIEFRPEERRMVLSLRGPSGGGYDSRADGGSAFDAEFRSRNKGGPGGMRRGGKKGRGGNDFEDGDEAGRRGFATSGATIGERLGALKGLISNKSDDEESTEESKSE